MAALFGALPVLLTALVFIFKPDTPSWLLGVIYLGFLFLGAWVFAEVFGN